MKKTIFLLASLILTGFNINASNSATTYINDYGNSFIFVENGVEFSVFRDGQFDFNILRDGSCLSINASTPNVNISFNSGYNYNAFVQYDEFGAIVQVENIPIFYDYYGRITRAGNINIHYNNFGYINRVGGLYIHYNRYNRFSHYTGYINRYNRRYIQRPWHRYYTVPARDYCVVYNRPYRRYYTPVRRYYNQPYYNNRRPVTAVASRRGTVITRHREYATVYRNQNRNSSHNRGYYTKKQPNYNSKTYRTPSNNNARQTKRYYNGNSRTTTSSSRQHIANNRNTRSSNVQTRRSAVQTPRGTVSRTTTRKTTVTRKPNTNANRTYTRSSTTTRKHNSAVVKRNAPTKNYSRYNRSVASTSVRRR